MSSYKARASRSASSISRCASLRISSAAHWAQRASIAATAALAQVWMSVCSMPCSLGIGRSTRIQTKAPRLGSVWKGRQ